MTSKILQRVGNFSQLADFIKQTKSLQIYSYQGKIRGVLYQDRKYRFTTLGVSKEKLQQLGQHQERLAQLELIREMHKGTKELARRR